MKKIIIFLLILLLTLTVSAESQFKNAGELFQYWEGNDAYPDYVCGVWSTDGGYINLTIAVLDTEEGNSGKEEILDLIENDATVTFAYGEYSYNYLRHVQDELEPYYGTETGLISSGVDVMGSRVNIGILTDKMNSPEALTMLEELRGKYGDVFTVEADEMVYDLMLEEKLPTIVTTPMQTARDYTAFVVICASLLFLLTFILLRRKVAVTDTGDSVTHSALSKRDVEDMISESTVDYPDELDEKIGNRIKKEN